MINKYNVSLEKISELLENEELMSINDIEEWVKVYNNQDTFLPINVIDRMMEVKI